MLGAVAGGGDSGSDMQRPSRAAAAKSRKADVDSKAASAADSESDAAATAMGAARASKRKDSGETAAMMKDPSAGGELHGASAGGLGGVDGPLVIALVCLAASMESADEAVLPACYDAIGRSLHISVAQLGSLTFGRSVVQAACCPFIAHFITDYPLLQVIGVACLGWGLATCLIAFVTTYAEILILRAVTGFCIALAIPAMRSLVSTASASSKRGAAFGFLQFGQSSGGIFAAALGTWLGGALIATPVGEVVGWRVVFFCFGVVSVGLGATILYLVPTPSERDARAKAAAQRMTVGEYWVMVKDIFAKKTFVLIIAQGIIGCMPWKAFVYLALVLQRAGFSDGEAATVVGLFQLGSTLGTLLGGLVADFLNARHAGGYILAAQISVASQLPLSYVCMELIPHEHAYFAWLCAGFFTFGLFISWCGSANSSILALVVPQQSLNAMFALNYGVQGSMSSAAIPLVALIARPDDARVGLDKDPLTDTIFRLTAFASLFLSVVYASLHGPFARERLEPHTITASKYAPVALDDDEHGVNDEHDNKDQSARAK